MSRRSPSASGSSRPLRHTAMPRFAPRWYDYAAARAMVALLVGIVVTFSFQHRRGRQRLPRGVSGGAHQHRRSFCTVAPAARPTAAVLANAPIGLWLSASPVRSCTSPPSRSAIRGGLALALVTSLGVEPADVARRPAATTPSLTHDRSSLRPLAENRDDRVASWSRLPWWSSASGPFIGSLIASLPTAGGAAMIILALEHPPQFIAQTAVGSLIANAACALFALSYAALAQKHALAGQPRRRFLVWLGAVFLSRLVDWNATGAVLLNAVIYPVAIFAGAALPHRGRSQARAS